MWTLDRLREKQKKKEKKKRRSKGSDVRGQGRGTADGPWRKRAKGRQTEALLHVSVLSLSAGTT